MKSSPVSLEKLFYPKSRSRYTRTRKPLPDSPPPRFIAWDTEDDGAGKLLFFSAFDGITGATFDTVPEFIKYVRDREPDFLLAHNAMYDLMNLVGAIEGAGEKIDYQVSTARGRFILGAFRYRKQVFHLRDLFNLFPYRLLDIGEKIVGMEKGNFETARKDPAAFRAYSIRDCEIVYYAYVKYIEFCAHEKIRPKITLGGTAMEAFLRKYLDRPILRPPDEVNAFIKEAYYGGRTEVFKHGKIENQNIFVYDVNSLYPYVMKNSKFPVGRWFEIDNPTPEDLPALYGKAGAVHAMVDEYQYFPVLPSRYNGKLMFMNGIKIGVWTLNELEYAVSQGAKIKEVYRIVYNTRSVFLFRKFVTDYYEKRRKFPEWSQFYKILLNSSYGKWGQGNTAETVTYGEPIKEEKVIRCLRCFDLILADRVMKIDQNEIYFSEFNSYIMAAIITAGARVHLHKMLSLLPPEEIIYSDTDSIFSFAEFPPETIGPEIGKLKLEFSGLVPEGYILLPKLYYLEPDKFAVKGIIADVDPITHKRIIDIDIFRRLFNDGSVSKVDRRPVKLKEFLRAKDRDTRRVNEWIDREKEIEMNYEKRDIIPSVEIRGMRDTLPLTVLNI